MSTTFTWSAVTLDRTIADGAVHTVHYTVNATDGTYQAGAYGSVGLEVGGTLIPYEDLTEEVVIGWVKKEIGGEERVAEIEASLQAKIDEQRDPVEASGTPW